MGIVHFLNVNDGDCIWISHPSKHNTVIDISNGKKLEESQSKNEMVDYVKISGGNHKQKEHPVNPIQYLKDFGVSSIFRFILTHPDMDHMDGIKEFFNNFSVCNFWDTENDKKIDEKSDWGKYSKEDWDFYQTVRKNETNPKCLHLYAGASGQFYNQDETGAAGADGLYILAPTIELVKKANESGDYNDCSYVILYKSNNGKKIIFSGDSATETWNYILENHKEEVENIDVLIAPHHGRKTGGNDDYLNILKPKLTLFGNAKSEHLDYQSWNDKGLDYITNNQANCIVLDTNGTNIKVYVTYETFAKKRNPYSFYSETHKAWYVLTL